MVNSLYAVMAVVGFVVLLVLTAYSVSFRRNAKSSFFTFTLAVNTVFCLGDAVWGFIAAGLVTDNVNVFRTSSMLFHLGASYAVYLWFAYTLYYLDYKVNLLRKILFSVPLIVEFGIAFSNMSNHNVFHIDENWVYHSGPIRTYLFVIQFCYLVAAIVAGVIKICRVSGKFQFMRYLIVIIYIVIFMFCGIMQMYYADAPFYSIGCMVAAIIAFIGNFARDERKVIEDESDYYQIANKEIFGAFRGIGEMFVSIHLFDRRENKQVAVKSTPQIDHFIDPNATAREQIMAVMSGVVVAGQRAKMVEFVDIDTLPDRMRGRNIISREFQGKNVGWCMSSFIRVASDDEGNPSRFIHAVQNINEIKLKENEYNNAIKQALETKNIIYAEMLRAQTNGVIAIDDDKKIVSINDAAARMMGYKDPGHVPASMDVAMENVVIEDLDTYIQNKDELNRSGKAFSFTASAKNCNNNELYLSMNMSSFELLNGQKVKILSVSDITKNRLAEEELKVLSETDVLTGISNRRSGEMNISGLLKNQIKGMMCIIDVNKFKIVNDTYGHHIGDMVLTEIAACLKRSFRDSDVVMRLGGDEFAVYARELDNPLVGGKCMESLFERINEISIAECPECKTSVSVGIAFYSGKGVIDYNKLYQQADSVMYISKDKGGNCYTIYKNNDKA